MECIFCEWWLMIIIFLIKSFYDNVYIIVKWVDEWFVYGYLFIYIIGWCGKMLWIGNDVCYFKYWVGIS